MIQKLQISYKCLAMKASRNLVVNWRSLDGAAQGRRKLHLRPNLNGFFTCPLLKICLHTDFKSCRGLRKHINKKHPWYFYFDRQPEVKKENMLEDVGTSRRKAFTAKKPAFTLEEGIGLTFLEWLTTSCGGGKTHKEAVQTGKRGMKFFMQALGNNEDGKELTYEFVDCCLGSANIIMYFLKTLEESWKLSSSGALNYVKALSDMIDFRKANGISDTTLRCFTVTEVYLRRAKENLRKRKNVECTRNLDLETLIAKDSWATIEEMEQVIPYHLNHYKRIIENCCSDGVVTKSDMVYCTRFITALLFLRVKCTRPMTFQFLTIEMIEKAKQNNGFIDQTEFKTASKYLFDTLIFTNDVLDVIDLYIRYVRPRLAPSCNYLLVSATGTQFQSLTNAMTMIVHQAIQKYINPTRYRQIIETESSDRLTIEEQRYISEDQKHSSQVAKIFYKKKHSRKVAIEGKKCMEKMTKECRIQSNGLMDVFNNMTNGVFDPNVLQQSRQILEGSSTIALEQQPSCSKEMDVDPFQPVDDLNDSTDFITTNPIYHQEPQKTISMDCVNIAPSCSSSGSNSEIFSNKDVVSKAKAGKNNKFTNEEDEHLNLAIKRYGRKSWAFILKDENFSFHRSRTRDSLRVRADSAAFKKKFNN